MIVGATLDESDPTLTESAAGKTYLMPVDQVEKDGRLVGVEMIVATPGSMKIMVRGTKMH